jgi:GT2 family glycosyltransferase
VRERVSIVIPTRDRGPLLLEAVASAVALEPAEVIVVDAHSTDGSVEAVEERFPGVRVLRGDFPNAAASRNAGTATAAAPYVGFLDSDDRALPGKIGGLVPVLDGDPHVVLAHGRMRVMDADGRESPGRTAEAELAFAAAEAFGTAYERLARTCSMFTSATLIRRSALDRVGGYDETLDVYEDWDLYLRLSLVGRLVYTPELAAVYRVWSGNVRWDRTAAGIIEVAERHCAALPELGRAAEREARLGFSRRLAESNHILVRPRAARAAVLDALRVDPRATLRDRLLVGTFLRSLLPAPLLRRRRPQLPSA